jgi:pilus assembly protein CpaF
MRSALEQVVQAVRSRLAEAAEGDDIDTISTAEVERIVERVGGLNDSDHQALVGAVKAEVAGYGPLQPLLDDENIEEIWINAPDAIFVARGGATEKLDLRLTTVQVRHLVERMLRSSGRRVDTATPFVDASLPDGSRLHVVIPDITSEHWSVNIRKFSRQLVDLDSLVTTGSLTQTQADYLVDCMDQGVNILISGATQAGKTTLLNALLAVVSSRQRIITVEETFELDVRGRDVVGLQCRQANLEGTGEITLRRLIKEALRMRPDRLVVGEVREAESLDLLIALNSGLPGACTIHANSAREALVKLCTLPLLAGRNIDASFVVPTVAACVHVVVHCQRDETGRRSVSQIVRLAGTVTNGVVDVMDVVL